MGTPPACMWATLYYAAHKEELMTRYSKYLLFYRRYIDDVFGIWNFDGTDECIDAYAFLQEDMEFKLLKWDFTTPSLECIFLNMTVSLVDGPLCTRLYEKALNLYLYLPPTSAHAPSVLHGLITGMILRIF